MKTISKVLIILFVCSGIAPFSDVAHARTKVDFVDVLREVFNIDMLEATDKELKDALKRMAKTDRDIIELRLMQIEAVRKYKEAGGRLSDRADALLQKTEDIGIWDAISGAIIPDPKIGLYIGEGVKIIVQAKGRQLFEIYSQERKVRDKDTAWNSFIEWIRPAGRWGTDKVRASFEFLYDAIEWVENEDLRNKEIERIKNRVLTNVSYIRERNAILIEENKRPWWKGVMETMLRGANVVVNVLWHEFIDRHDIHQKGATHVARQGHLGVPAGDQSKLLERQVNMEVRTQLSPVDTIPPYLVSSYPADGATNVPVTLRSISWTFNEPMSGGFDIHTEGAYLPGGPLGTFSETWSSDMKTLTSTYSENWTAGSTMTWTLNPDYEMAKRYPQYYFSDKAGNALPTTSGSFTTAP